MNIIEYKPENVAIVPWVNHANPQSEKIEGVKKVVDVSLDVCCFGVNLATKDAAAKKYPDVPAPIRNIVVDYTVHKAEGCTKAVAHKAIESNACCGSESSLGSRAIDRFC